MNPMLGGTIILSPSALAARKEYLVAKARYLALKGQAGGK
jgi:hypothetical protein